jgi:hypothetical protein
MTIDPDRKRRYDACTARVREHEAKRDVDGAVQALRDAAAVFAGSREADELDLRHRALADIAAWLKAAKRPEAEAAFAELARVAGAEAGRLSYPALFATYSIGKLRQDRHDDENALAPLGEAEAGFVEAGNAEEALLAGAARGLSAIRVARWADAATILVAVRARFAANTDDTTRASVLHNLAVALVRSERAAEAVKIGAEAVAVRTRKDGANHPLTIETQLVHARALVDAGQLDAALPIARAAAAVILAGAGEAHPFFADALLVEARRATRTGDGTAGEALARRALHVLAVAETPADAARQRHRDAAELAPLWRIGTPARGVDDVALWEIAIDHTLRRYRAATLDFIGSGDRPKRWYFVVPAHWDPAAHAAYAARVVFADQNAALNAREPADANFLDATRVQARAVAGDAIFAIPLVEAFQSRVWEASVAWNLLAGASSSAMAAADFGRVAAALACAGGARSPRAWLAPLTLDDGELRRIETEPRAVLAAAFGHR